MSSFIDYTEKSVLGLIKKWLNIHKSIKVHLCVTGTYEKDLKNIEKKKYLKTSNYEIFLESDLSEIYKDMKNKILYTHEKVSDSLEGSQWILQSIDCLKIAVNKADPIRGSSFIKTPKVL